MLDSNIIAHNRMSVLHCKRICQIIKVRHWFTLLNSFIDPWILNTWLPYTAITQLKPEFEAEYKSIHANVWPGVLAALERHHIIDYSIHHYAPLHLLIANFKYSGTDYEKDMASVGQDEETRRWWKVTDGMQESFVEGAEGSGKDVSWWTVCFCVRQLLSDMH